LPGIARIVITSGVVVWCGGGSGGFFTDNNTTPTKVVLSCFGLLVGLWQLLNNTPQTIDFDILRADISSLLCL
jgi:hypothetical protein